MAPVVAIELDDSSHEEEDRQSRDSFIDAAFSAANFPLIRIPYQRGYQLDEVWQLLAPYLSLHTPPASNSGTTADN